MAHEKNIAALLRADARTVHVSFLLDSVEADFPEDSDIEADRLIVAEQRRRAKMDLSKPPYVQPVTYAVKPARRTYTYVTHLPVKEGDIVVVDARGALTLAAVRFVDDEVKIEPGSQNTYKWVVGTVDLSAYQENTARNREIEQTVAEGMRANLRRSFANSFMAGLAPDASAKLGSLIGDTLPLGSPGGEDVAG